MAHKIVYSDKTHTTGGREGASRSSDGALDIALAPPGSGRTGTNPEQLFAAGWSACFLAAVGKAAGEHKLNLPADASIDAKIDLALDDGGYALIAHLDVSLPGIDRATAEVLTARAHEICPYSKATRGNIAVEINII